MSVQIHFSEGAIQDLRDIWRGLSFADSTLAKLESKFQLLTMRVITQMLNSTLN